MEMFLSDSDCESSSESSCSDYLDDIDSMYGGQAQSILSNLEKSIGRIDDFLAFERGFIHGDIVCSVTDPSGQLGRVVEVDIVVDLETARGEILKEVNCNKLLKIRPLIVGDYVVHGPWLGRVSRVIDRLTILFDDGAKCELTAVNPENIAPVSPSIVEDSQYSYYPGQHVQTRLSSVFKSARWLCGAWKENRAEGTVCHVDAGLVYVDWVASAMIGCNMSIPAPPYLQDSNNLTLLSCFSHANWQLGDWCILPVYDQSIAKEHVLNGYRMDHINEHTKLERGVQESNSHSSSEEIFVIVKRKTKVDVLWQDGNRSIGLDSQSILPANSIGDHEFWPEQFVLEKSCCDDPHFLSSQRLGIVKSVDAKERTVRLKWKTHAENQAKDWDGKYNEETVSAYELIEHPDYSYCLGDIVFKLGKILSFVQADESECDGQLITDIRSGSGQQLGENCLTSKPDSEDHWKYPNKCYLSCIGHVIEFKDEGIVVRWASGLTSKVGPWEIVGIDKYENPVAVHVLNEDIEDNLTQEIPHRKDKDVLEYSSSSVGGDHHKDICKTRTSFFPQAAVGFFKSIAVSLFGSHGSTSLSGSMESTPVDFSENSNLDPNQSASDIANESESLCVKEELKCCNLTTVQLSELDDLQTSSKQQVEEPQENKAPYYSFTSEKSGRLKQFDTVGDVSDHYFVNGAGKGSMLPQVKRGWLKKVQQEWSILEKDLPANTIYVRVYEERIDLLRAAIVGASGTPYHDGLFFFDFFLPPDYPYEPPMVHYNSGGLRLNPNLYESGRICLSLLNTWTGTDTEAWNPGSSTILQVLLSLQALVLNERPYFNEAGYDIQIGKAEGEKNSITYNENAFLLTCKSMLYILSKPPKHFESLVEEHFRSRWHSILLACKAYMDGAPAGCAFGCGAVLRESQKSSSTGFKIMLAKLFPKLVSAFMDKGIDCSQFLEPENECMGN